MPKTSRLIAIVDDDHSVRRALHRLIRRAGFTPETFASAELFLVSASRVHTACLVVDIHLNGGMDGFNLQAQLIADQSSVPLIFMTAYDHVLLRARVEASGAVAYLCKPFDDALLLDAIRAAVAEGTGRGDVAP